MKRGKLDSSVVERSVDEFKVHTRIACIGAGHWGRNLVRNFHDLGVLKWICDSSQEKRTQLLMECPTARIVDSLDQVLADPEVAGVAIATPAETSWADSEASPARW